MVLPSELTWAEQGYVDRNGDHWQGYIWPGRSPWVPPAVMTDDQKFGRVVMATESAGCFLDAAQSYDVMGLTVGAIQWGEIRSWAVTKMFGACYAQDPKLLEPLRPVMDRCRVSMQQRSTGAWRWRLRDGTWVDTPEKQSKLLRLNSSGKIGTWDAASKEVNALWVAGSASVFQIPAAQQVQLAYTFAQIRSFALPEAKKILWGPETPSKEEGIHGALRAIYLSFAANNPTIAQTRLLEAVRQSKAVRWSDDWVADVLNELVFGPDIAFYPKRYGDLLKVVPGLYGVSLPDIEIEGEALRDVASMQRALIALGHNLGPKGADGVAGPKTAAAIQAFQRAWKLPVTGNYTSLTRTYLLHALESKGIAP